jgi:hypothetical protein
VFDAEFEKRHFAAIESEAEQRSVVTWQPEQFLLLHAAAEPLRASLSTQGSAVEQFGPLLFQATTTGVFRKRISRSASRYFGTSWTISRVLVNGSSFPPLLRATCSCRAIFSGRVLPMMRHQKRLTACSGRSLALMAHGFRPSRAPICWSCLV